MTDPDRQDSQSAQRELALIASAARKAETLAALYPPELPPDVIPGYRLVREMGRGGMGVVYEARQTSTRRSVAVKVLLAGPFASLTTRRRFQREVELAARLQHSGIVRVFESGSTSLGQPYYSMDLIDGIELHQWLFSERPSEATVLRTFAAMCDAIEHAHHQGVVHRDLKPANVLVDREGQPHILDFGLSKATDPGNLAETLTVSTTTPGYVVGTLRYLSPEQAAGKPTEVDERTDVYALGVMLYEALTGRPPFESGAAPHDLMRQIREDPPPRPSALSPRVSRDLETILLKALEKEPQRRYASAGDLAADLRRHLAGEPILARAPSSLYLLRKRVSKHRAPIAIVALAVIIVVTFGFVWAQSHWAARQERLRLADGRRSAVYVQYHVESNALGAAEEAEALCARHGNVPEAPLVLAHARFLRGWSRETEDRLSDTVNALARYCGRDAPRPECAALLAEVCARAGDQTRARRYQEIAARHPPQSAEDWYLRSFATLDLQVARQCLETAAAQNPSQDLRLPLLIRQAHLHKVLGNTDLALAAAEQLVARDQNPKHWRLFQGRVLTRARRHSEAAAHYAKMIQQWPEGYMFWQHLAHNHLCRGDYEQAASAYTRAIELDQSRPSWAQYRRATAWWALGRHESATRDYVEFSRERQRLSFADARLFLVREDHARVLDLAGRAAEAEAIHRKAAQELATARAKTDPDRWLAQVTACVVGELEPEALVAAADPDRPERICESYYYAGEACLLRDNLDEARDWLRRCVDTDLVFDPDSRELDPMNEYHLARWRLGQLANQEQLATEAPLATP